MHLNLAVDSVFCDYNLAFILTFCSFRALAYATLDKLSIFAVGCHSSFQMMLISCVMFTGGKDLQQYVTCCVYDWHGRNNESRT